MKENSNILNGRFINRAKPDYPALEFTFEFDYVVQNSSSMRDQIFVNCVSSKKLIILASYLAWKYITSVKSFLPAETGKY
jgi:hypothetical protein